MDGEALWTLVSTNQPLEYSGPHSNANCFVQGIPAKKTLLSYKMMLLAMHADLLPGQAVTPQRRAKYSAPVL